MSSQGSPRLELDVRRRRWERWVAWFALVVVAATPWQLSWPLSISIPCSAGILLLVATGLYRAGWLGRSSLRRIVWLADGRWLLVDAAGRACEGRLRADSRVGARFAWLRWDANRTRSMLLIAADPVDPELRRLIVRLRIEGVARSPAAAA